LFACIISIEHLMAAFCARISNVVVECDDLTADPRRFGAAVRQLLDPRRFSLSSGDASSYIPRSSKADPRFRR
jgi:hypothetical protein